MASVRDHIGSKCPCCARDILQNAPSTNRMPEGDLAWCPTCKTTMTADDLMRRRAKAGGGLLRRLFGRPQQA